MHSFTDNEWEYITGAFIHGAALSHGEFPQKTGLSYKEALHYDSTSERTFSASEFAKITAAYGDSLKGIGAWDFEVVSGLSWDKAQELLEKLESYVNNITT